MTQMSKVFKIGLFCALFQGAVLMAVDFTVTVYCNGQQIPRPIPIQVYDSNGTLVPNLTKTNNQGVFVIPDSETYVQPFQMAYFSKGGSYCGPEFVSNESSTVGRVDLNYYPTELPCSCAKFFE